MEAASNASRGGGSIAVQSISNYPMPCHSSLFSLDSTGRFLHTRVWRVSNQYLVNSYLIQIGGSYNSMPINYSVARVDSVLVADDLWTWCKPVGVVSHHSSLWWGPTSNPQTFRCLFPHVTAIIPWKLLCD